ncbi:hypothetical protein [Halorubrum sp. BV1]|uniref:DNA replication complex subunit Gins51 n=1 Tax=Halorubrum sp. BV1 TaxID=1498500 RepID=UPI0006795817|nr:hypothetical protein [Halorubrum sp. BV1]
MNLDELRSAQAKERRKDSLQHLRDSFYDDVAAYVADLRAARDRRAEQVEKPFSDDDVRRMSDEVETAEEVAEALYERRVGKVVKLASFAAADMPVEDEGMTTEERELFDDLVGRISQNKSRVLDVLSGDAPPSSGSDPATQSADPDPSTAASTDSTAVSTDSDVATASDDTDASALAGAMGGSAGTTGDSPLDDAPTDDAASDDAGAPAVPSEATTADGTGERPPDDIVGTKTSRDDTSHDDASRDDAPRDTAADGSGEQTASTVPTEVPPEPAPPGAPGVEESNPNATDADAPDGDRERGSDRTNDGGSGGSPGDDTPAHDNRTTVRVTRDVGPILGVDDREYDLASEDVVTLPAENADPLVQRDAAERLD